MVGVHPDYPRLISLTGGFKISFGLAHRLADEALAVVCGADARLPQGFTLVDHINVVLGDI
jgi:glycine oxidase